MLTVDYLLIPSMMEKLIPCCHQFPVLDQRVGEIEKIVSGTILKIIFAVDSLLFARWIRVFFLHSNWCLSVVKIDLYRA
jgi:hypothetical protein